MERKGKYNIDSKSQAIGNIHSLTTGLGNESYDPSENVFIGGTYQYSRQELMNAYRSFWFCRKVCDYLPNTMIRGWGSLNMEESGNLIESKVNKRLTGALIRKLYCRGQQLANLYGGAVVIRYVQDDKKLHEPIDKYFYRKNQNVQIQYSRIYNPWEVYPYSQNTWEDIEHPEFYQVSTGDTENTTYIHKDRILRFRGAPTDFETMRANRGFEDSLLIPFLSPALKYLTAINHVGASVTSFEFIVHKLENLFSELENEESQRHLEERLAVAHKTISSLRGLVLDKNEEEVDVIARNYAGVTDIIKVLLDEMIAASGLTKPEFIQEHPSGLGSTGESERLAQADKIKNTQIEKWGENIEWDAQLHLWALGYYGENWKWEWGNLFQQTPLEQADITLKMAQAQQILNNVSLVTNTLP